MIIRLILVLLTLVCDLVSAQQLSKTEEQRFSRATLQKVKTVEDLYLHAPSDHSVHSVHFLGNIDEEPYQASGEGSMLSDSARALLKSASANDVIYVSIKYQPNPPLKKIKVVGLIIKVVE